MFKKYSHLNPQPTVTEVSAYEDLKTIYYKMLSASQSRISGTVCELV